MAQALSEAAALPGASSKLLLERVKFIETTIHALYKRRGLLRRLLRGLGPISSSEKPFFWQPPPPQHVAVYGRRELRFFDLYRNP